MKALFFKEHGDLSRLTYGDLPDLKAAPGQVVLKVKACALNHLDLWVLKGWPGLTLELPHIGGSDIAGEIAELGEGVRDWKVGDRVALTPGYIPNGHADSYTTRNEDSLSPAYRIFGETIRGGLAELIQAPAHTLLRIPSELSFAQAAAPLLVATTAWRMLKHRAQLQSGETVLVVGAGGGLNSFSIWLAKDLGAKVIALTRGPAKLAKAKDFGADEVIDYREHLEWSSVVRKLTDKRGVDVVIDNVGAASYSESLRSLARGGRLVTVGNTSGHTVAFDNRLIFGKQLSILGSSMGSARDAKAAAEYAWKKPLSKLIDRELALQEGLQAYQALEKGSQFGKIVLHP